MRTFLFVIIGLLLAAGTTVSELSAIRTAFFHATDNKGIQQFYTLSQSLDEKNITLKAYKGTATAMYAAVASSPGSKLRYFNNGKALLEEAVKNDPNNAEIRFLRFAVQSETPAILGYSSKLKEDALFIIEALEQKKVKTTDAFWKKAIRIMEKSKALDSKQKERLKKSKTT